MLERLSLPTIALGLALACSACVEEPADVIDLSECEGECWTLSRYQLPDSVTPPRAYIEDGTLILENTEPAPASRTCDVTPCMPVAVYQVGLSGDFDAFVDIASIDGIPGTRVNVYVSDRSAYHVALGGLKILEDGSSAAFVSIVNIEGHRASTGSKTERAAIVRIVRSGSQITMTVTGYSGSVSETALFTDRDVTIGLGLDVPHSETDGHATGIIESVTIFGSTTTVHSDQFERDTIR